MSKLSLTSDQKLSFNYLIAGLVSIVPFIEFFMNQAGLFEKIIPVYLTNMIPLTLLILYISSVAIGFFLKIKGLMLSFIFFIVLLLISLIAFGGIPGGMGMLFLILFLIFIGLLFAIFELVKVQIILYSISKKYVLPLGGFILVNNVILAISVLSLPGLLLSRKYIKIDDFLEYYLNFFACVLLFITSFVLVGYLCYLLKKSE
jgi:hypothetical protein